MILKFSYWGKESPYYIEPYIVKSFRHFEIGSKLVGLQINGGRPFEVSFNKEELLYLINNPKYLRHLFGALRDTSVPLGQANNDN